MLQAIWVWDLRCIVSKYMDWTWHSCVFCLFLFLSTLFLITLSTIKISVTRHFDFARTSLLLGIFNRSNKIFLPDGCEVWNNRHTIWHVNYSMFGQVVLLSPIISCSGMAFRIKILCVTCCVTLILPSFILNVIQCLCVVFWSGERKL